MNTPSRFEISTEQVERNARGVAACRALVDDLLARRAAPDTDGAPLTPSDEIHQRALERAVAEKRGQRLIGVERLGLIFDEVRRAHR